MSTKADAFLALQDRVPGLVWLCQQCLPRNDVAKLYCSGSEVQKETVDAADKPKSLLRKLKVSVDPLLRNPPLLPLSPESPLNKGMTSAKPITIMVTAPMV